MNFSVLGLTIILALGGLIIVIGMSIDTIVGLLRTRTRRYKKEQWDAEETLELHRAAYAGLGYGIEGEMPPSTIFSRGSALQEKAEAVAFIPGHDGDQED